MCGAAGVLTALGVRVVVVPPSVAWPRSGRLVVDNRAGWLGELALRTVVPDEPGGDVGPARPVAIHCRTACGEKVAVGDRPWDDLQRVVAARDLVFEVRLLPPSGCGETAARPG
ncbi:hypothetical protein [Geodermatophilus sp. URMC 64]